MVITRYLYKPDAAEGMTRFNDNRRLHIFVVDVASGEVEQLTDGDVLRAFDRLVAGRPASCCSSRIATPTTTSSSTTTSSR